MAPDSAGLLELILLELGLRSAPWLTAAMTLVNRDKPTHCDVLRLAVSVRMSMHAAQVKLAV